MSKKHDKNWEKLINSIFFSSTDLIHEVTIALDDIYQTWFSKETILNTGLRRMERVDKDGAKDFIKQS